jgi:hypothetical protein
MLSIVPLTVVVCLKLVQVDQPQMWNNLLKKDTFVGILWRVLA